MMSNVAVAQSPQSEQTPPDSTESFVRFPRNMIGVRGGVNFSDMRYSYNRINQYYKHFLQTQGMGGIFGYFQLGRSNFALRPEISFVGRADSLEWKDVHYRLKAHYVDFRLPLTYNIRFRDGHVSPYLMVAPQLNMAYGGKATYHAEDFPNGVEAPVTSADINPYDASLMLGGGFDFLIPTQGVPVVFSIEAGYNIGLWNTFAPREIRNNPDVAPDNRSVIANLFPRAELYREARKNRGIEVALRLALPLDDSWKGSRPKKETPAITLTDTIYMPDTVYVRESDTTIRIQTDTVYILKPINNGDNSEYVRKDCYSFGEMYAFVKLGIDISDKRLCLFNINFDFDSYRLRSESFPHLDEVAMMMNAYPEMCIKIMGHTDSLGSDQYNETLSLNRAKSVMRYLNTKGISLDRMEPAGYGEKYPIETNSTDEGRFHNRRVEIEILDVGIRNTDTNNVEPQPEEPQPQE